jgi:hypothetical protein
VDVLSHGQAVFGIAVGRVWADTEGDLAHLSADERTGPRTRAAEDEPVAKAAGGLPGRGAPPGAEA